MSQVREFELENGTKVKAWYTVDKTEWEDGDWKEEPDKAQWIDKDTGYDCLIVRNGSGALCGYVGLPANHPHHGSHYDDIDVVIHGGLTFTGKCSPNETEATGICHTGVVANESPMWQGFDCAHSGDLMPKYNGGFEGDYYRDFKYVVAQVTDLAKQFKGSNHENNYFR